MRNLEEEIKQKDDKIQQIMKEKEELEEKFQVEIDSLECQRREQEDILTHV
ncbi:hypothetical protein [Wolbachia endosymbiont of Mansonella perstans]|uniref:hypothetical protein n=1 Tax=Wolbachia endosymbiont of Mansonella perstans TaxID=229526 RepID=UPI001CE217C5|nr:hypothetical protein [Wolbachia endosymbiont of Mansonella perstans]MCA4774139.1 hypothetical protein [Wolbachia endosymbiont of Mansonella perstans]